MNWVPDEEGRGCVICHAEFSLTRRRHHCRKCGALVCGTCSDHFMVLPGETSEVRVCDTCELKLKEAAAVGEKMDVNAQITLSLKSALKEKASELELFNAFALHVLDHQESSQPDPQLVVEAIKKICADLTKRTEVYNEVKMDAADLEKEIRRVAQRCLRAEDVTREGLSISREIEEYSKHIGRQGRLIEQLDERIDRLSTRAQSPPPRTPPRSPELRAMSPPRVEVLELNRPQSQTASVCQVLKSLLSPG